MPKQRYPERLQMMVAQYQSGESLKEVAKRWKLTPEAVYGLFRYHDIPRRSSADGKRLAIQRRRMMQ